MRVCKDTSDVASDGLVMQSLMIDVSTYITSRRVSRVLNLVN